MKSFFKIFLASLLALLLFAAVAVFVGIKMASRALDPGKPAVAKNTVLVLDLSKAMKEQRQSSNISVSSGQSPAVNGLFDVVRAIRYAKTDASVAGIYLKCATNPNGYASSEELRHALQDFKTSGKFIWAYANEITQKAWYVASAGDSLFCNPRGMVEWNGFSMQYVFLKGMLDKLEVKPEIFYAGQFKSATEPLREMGMTPANRLQSATFLNELYAGFLEAGSQKTGQDSTALHTLADRLSVRTAWDADRQHLVDGLRYDDEIKLAIQAKCGLKPAEKIPFMPIAEYIASLDMERSGMNAHIALVFAEGDIVDGQGSADNIGGEKYIAVLRNLRLDSSIKAVVFRVNSGGGSAMASEMIWREMTLLRKLKPVVVSMGDYAASGGYYISCNADTIFAQRNTLTGSIGVFTVYGNLAGLMTNKLGITFDGVKTSSSADFGNTFRPMTNAEKLYAQAVVDSIYANFKHRVTAGRHLSIPVVDSIAQGRIWSGTMAIRLGLVDRIGGIQDAVDCAARMARLKNYQLREVPVVASFWQKILNAESDAGEENAVSSLAGKSNLDLFRQARLVTTWFGTPQARMPLLRIGADR